MTKSKEDAVSPVIGVILMVAVTVILAAVIAAFVFGMGSNVSKTKVVAVTAAQDSATGGTITYQGGQDAASLNSVGYIVGTANMAFMNATSTTTPLAVGTSATLTGLTANKDHIVATGFFLDGSSQVLLDTYV